MTQGQRVLVVDGLAETEEVLKAVLEPQGLEVNRIRTHLAHPPHADRPHLVVLHEDRASEPPEDSHAWPDVPRVVIGAMTPAVCSTQQRARYLSQPFEYRDLIQAVETLLAE